jgi:hypothetical protein
LDTPYIAFYELSDFEWEVVKHLLLPRSGLASIREHEMVAVDSSTVEARKRAHKIRWI